MIRIHGDISGSEGDAARKLREVIVRAWPWVQVDPVAQVDIVAGVKCHGQSTSDLDVVLLAYFPQRGDFAPYLNFLRRWDSQWVRPARVRVESLCAVIELKLSDPRDVRFIGSRLEVYYRDPTPRWHNASEQSHKQIFALKNYLESQGLTPPFVTNLVWLPNVDRTQLPPRPHNYLGTGLTWELLLNTVGQLRAPDEDDGEWTVRAWPAPATADHRAVVLALTRRLEPTRLDRVRMSRVCEEAFQADWLHDLGTRQLVFRGRGGTGKTMLLLQAAWRAHSDLGKRVVILTYNPALLADIRRLLTLVTDTHGLRGGGIQANTIMSFFASAFRGLGLTDRDTDFLADYDTLKRDALSLVTRDDAAKLVTEHTEAFGWDLVFVDECQDWPADERDLLRRFYPCTAFALADGVDQFVRGNSPCDWLDGVPKREARVVPLSACLRMKSNLAHFANRFAAEIGAVGWRVEANSAAGGGRVIVVDGSYFGAPELHSRVVDANAADGNQAVDMLACVPPSFATRVREDSDGSLAAALFAARGQEVWDGVNATVRQSYPVSVHQLRIVQYDSCRGLEGWVVVALAFDELYSYKHATWQPPPPAPGVLTDVEDAHRHAARWLMMPLTRAVDTLVIQIAQAPSPVRDALLRLRESCSDFLEWVGPLPAGGTGP